METLIHEIEKQNFFYDLIATMAYSHFGPNELLSRGLMMENIKHSSNRIEFIKKIKTLQFPLDVENQIFATKTFTPNIFIPLFRTKFGNKTYRMDPDYSAAHFIADTKGITDVPVRITLMTILSSYERIIEKTKNDSPVKQFFRHIRNAAAHNGKLHFDRKVIDKKTNDLIAPAEWREFKITFSLQGTRLFPLTQDDNDAFWDQGDFIEFLLDFENHHPEIKNQLFR